MDRGDNSSAVVCNLCGEAFTLPEDEADGNLPRVLSCGHIYCTTCLLSIQYDSVIRCPECEVEFTVPEGGVYGLQEESRIIGLMYTAKMNQIRRCERLKTCRRKTFPPSPDMNANKGDMQQPADLKKIKKTVDEALCRGAENLAQLEHIYKTLTTGLAEQVKRERARLEMELKQAADKAVHAVQKWKDGQLKQLSKLEAQFSTTQVVVCCVRERIKTLKISMQMAKEICRVPFLEQHCTLDKVLKTLQAPVDSRSYDMKCTNMDSGMRCSPWRAESKNSNCTPPKPRCANTRKQAQKSPASHSLSSESSSPSPKPRHRFRISQHNATSNLQTPDVIVEHLEESQKHALPPTGPELANGRGRINRRRRCQVFDKSRSVTQWVVVAHIVNPNQFYVHYVTEKKENETLSRKINQFCYKDGSHFTASSVVFVKWTDGLWCRANVLQIVEIGCVEDVKACPVDQLASIQVYFLDYGLTKSLIIQNDEATTESSLKAVNNHLRKVTEAMNMELGHFVPQAIRCSLKDLVPYDLVHNMESLLLSAKLQECYSATETGGDHLRVYCPVMGQAYVARYDDKWYRAQVIGVSDDSIAQPIASKVGIPGGREVEVYYVDFGNKNILSVSDLRMIKDEFFALPSMAIHCCLSDVIPLDGESWSDACTKRLISLVYQKLVTIVATETVPKTKPLPIKLFESILDRPLSNIAELLVKEGLACFKGGLKSKDASLPGDESAVWDPPLEHSLATGDADAPDQKITGEQGEELLDVQPLLKLQTQLKDLKVKVSHVNSPSSFYVQLLQYNSQLKRVCELVKKECALTEPQDVAWKADMYCAAHMNGVWERGQISSDVTSSDIAEELTDERPVPVTLFCSNRTGQFVSIADFLTSEGLALRERKPRNADVHDPKESDAQSPARETQTECSDDGNTHPSPFLKPTPSPSSHTPPKPAPRTIMSAEKVTTKLYQPPELPCPGHIQITVSAIREDGLIYGRTENAECQLEQLRERIHQSIKTLPRPKSYTWKSVLGCAVIGPDMLWYRGQLLEVLGGHVKVQYVDYGLVENIPVVHVYPILLCEDVPQLCMPFQLHNVNPVGGKWQQDAVAMLREMLLNRSVDIDIMGLEGPQEPLLGPFIYPDLPQEGEHFPVRVKHLLTPNELFLWPQREGVADVEVDGETLDEALSRINANIDSLPQLNSFSCGDISSLLFPGGPCLAEYSDGNYYRAKLIRFISAEPIMVLVQHVDFGSDDTLPITKLREMPAELLRFPSRALKVKVAGFKAPSVRNRREDMLPYSPEWSVKATMEMIDLLNGRIEATVVAREPELTVLLYNEDGELVHLPLVSSGLAELE
ncbi:RING finger protein 17 [Larimichthys crocea]|uniref:Uncharacterized protein n=1 Tax=Larimichthys crocea TaxID=215358 RepID=A0ACD3QI55_LARCR|nr:RING finger protein 17 [Larimichthys crocea]